MVEKILAALGRFFLKCIRLAGGERPQEAAAQLSQEILSEWLGGSSCEGWRK